MALLEIESLSKTFPATGVHAADSLSLSIEAGAFTVIVGPSGCGKTTFLRLTAGLEKPDAGKIILASHNGQKPRIALMFQDARLLPWLSVKANLRLAFPAKEAKTDAANKTIEGLLAMTGLSGWENSKPGQLSGGMAQRAALARALCRKPDILLLDEPFGSLDAFTRTRLRKTLDGLWKKLGLTVVLVTHDIEEAVFFADRVVRMQQGRFRQFYPVALPRPREVHSVEFQALCSHIENDIGSE
jgi:sulfonate transport system ATP-binding protein